MVQDKEFLRVYALAYRTRLAIRIGFRIEKRSQVGHLLASESETEC